MSEEDAERRPASSDIKDAEKLSDQEFEEYSKKKEKPAHVIGANRAEHEGTVGTDIVINRGEIDGVAVNDVGIVVGPNAKLVVKTVYKKSCVAFVAAKDATYEEIKENKDVVLNRSS